MDTLHSLRVSIDIWAYEDRFRSMVDHLTGKQTGIGQIALFSSGVHTPLPLEEVQKRCAIQKERMKVLREHGWSAGINVLATIGHHEEDLPNSLHGPYVFMTGRHGEASRGVHCMNDARYLEEYVVPLYTMTAQAEPDFIWIDDDVRLGHFGIGTGCYCDNCIRRFNEENGTAYTRETLTEALDGDVLPVRRAWLRFQSKTVGRLLSLIGKTVRAVDPKIILGFMTGERYQEGFDFSGWADALSEGGKYPILWRPGGGAYEDYDLRTTMDKASSIGRQTAYLPECVVSRQSEIENFPYQLIKKTPTSTALEAAWTMTAGCTGAAFNILPSETGEPFTTILPHLNAIADMEPFCRLLAEKTAGKQPVGIRTGWKPESQVSVPAGNYDESFGGMFASFAEEFFDFGLPQCYREDNACVTLLSGRFGNAWSDEELSALLRDGIYADKAALECLTDRGFAAQLGFRVGQAYPVDARETYLACPENEGISGGIRNCRQSFYRGDAVSMIPTQPGTRAIAALMDYHGERLTDCCLGAYENADGGRVCAAGYYPFTWISDSFKTTQLKRLMVWLSRERLPSYVESFARIRNHTFIDGDRVTVALCNPTSEPLRELRVAVRTDKGTAVWYGQDCVRKELTAEAAEGKYRFFTVPLLPSFEIGLLEA